MVLFILNQTEWTKITLVLPYVKLDNYLERKKGKAEEYPIAPELVKIIEFE